MVHELVTDSRLVGNNTLRSDRRTIHWMQRFNGKLVGTVNIADVTDDDLLSMIILGKNPSEKEDA